MEAMLGISPYSYPYPKLANTAMSFLLLLMSSLQQNWRRRQNRFCLEVRGAWGGEGRGKGQWGEMAQTIYAHINKWIKKKNCEIVVEITANQYWNRVLVRTMMKMVSIRQENRHHIGKFLWSQWNVYLTVTPCIPISPPSLFKKKIQISNVFKTARYLLII
jgi:hypothetical protein